MVGNRFGRIDADDRLDRYFTPEWATEALLDSINPFLPRGVCICEPCAGMGHIVRVLERYNYRNILAGDIDPESPFCNGVDATRSEELKNEYSDADIVITNPPYNADTGSAKDVIWSLINGLDVPVFALLRLSFLEKASNRGPILEQMDSILILPRVKFEGPAIPEDSNGPGETSAWMLWRPGTDVNPSISWFDESEQSKIL